MLRAESEARFMELGRPVLSHPEYRLLSRYGHHGRSVYQHCRSVAELAFAVGGGRSRRSAELVRGALLHDFFLYDWRTERRPGGRMHGFSHPRIALGNAERVFGPLTPIEKDIILHHMWPLTPEPPRSREAMIVCALDKLVAGYEFARSLLRGGR